MITRVPGRVKPWHRLLVKELSDVQSPIEVMCAITKVLDRYKVGMPEVVAYVKALGEKARTQHEEGEVLNDHREATED